MKKLILAVLLVIVLLPIMAFAQTEVEAWYWNDTLATPGWIYIGLNNVAAQARCWNTGFANGACNKPHWDIPVTITADVAQWIEWSMSGTSWLWRIRKPGTYAADCITANVKSNQNVLVNYEGFADLQYDTVASGGKHSVNPVIPIWYAVSEVGALPSALVWTPAANLNNSAEFDTLKDSMDLHNGMAWKLWNKIMVVNCNSACQYKNQAKITLELLCQKDWIDSLGYFKAGSKPPVAP